MLLLGGDLHHGAQGLSGLNVGEAPPRGDLTQAVHVSGCDQQVADESRHSHAEPQQYLRFFGSCPHINLPGKHVTGFFDFVTWNVMFDIGLVYPRLDVDDLLPVVV